VVVGRGLEAGRGDWVKVHRLTEVTGNGIEAGRGDWIKV
jgi:hypothetical protein